MHKFTQLCAFIILSSTLVQQVISAQTNSREWTQQKEEENQAWNRSQNQGYVAQTDPREWTQQREAESQAWNRAQNQGGYTPYQEWTQQREVENQTWNRNQRNMNR